MAYIIRVLVTCCSNQGWPKRRPAGTVLGNWRRLVGLDWSSEVNGSTLATRQPLAITNPTDDRSTTH